MTEATSESVSAQTTAKVAWRLSGNPRASFALIAGGLTLAVWAGLLASSFLGVSDGSNRLLADLLLGLVIVCTIAAVVASVRWGIGAAVAALAYVAAWYYIGWSLTYAIQDALYLGLVAVFFLAPPINGVMGLLAGRSNGRRAG